MARLLPLALAFAVLVYALIDCARTPNEEMPAGLPKPLWMVLIVLLPLVGPIGWLVARRMTTSNRRPGPGRGGPTPGTPGRRPPARGPVAPDDDPEFLAKLERERRRAERERREQERRGGGGSDGGHETTDPGQVG